MDNKKTRKLSLRGGFYYNNELWYSKAYQELPKAAMNLLHDLLNELRWPRSKKQRVYSNNGSLSFTENQFKDWYGYQSETYTRSRNLLIKNGLITQTYRGGYGKGDRARYKLLFVDGVPYGEQRWRGYPENNWANDIPKLKKQSIGKKTQFRKGKSGRKIISTLINRGPKEPNNPKQSIPITQETP